MRRGARGKSNGSGAWRLTPLRCVALTVGAVGVALTIFGDRDTGFYVLACAYATGAVEERLYGSTGDGTLYVCLAFLLMSVASAWTLGIWLSAAGVVCTGLPWLYREYGPLRRNSASEDA